MAKTLNGLLVLNAAIAAVDAWTQNATGAIAFANGYRFANGAFRRECSVRPTHRVDRSMQLVSETSLTPRFPRRLPIVPSR
jgi:hypothetical protein